MKPEFNDTFKDEDESDLGMWNTGQLDKDESQVIPNGSGYRTVLPPDEDK